MVMSWYSVINTSRRLVVSLAGFVIACDNKMVTPTCLHDAVRSELRASFLLYDAVVVVVPRRRLANQSTNVILTVYKYN